MWHQVNIEIRNVLLGRLGPVAIVLFLLTGFLFLWILPSSSYLTYGLGGNTHYFETCSFLLLFIVPALSAGLLSNEFQQGTTELLAGLPLGWAGILWAKFIAGMVLLAVMIALSFPNIYVLNVLSENPGSLFDAPLAGAYLGLLFIGAVFLSIGLFVSAWTEQGPIAFILSILLAYVFYHGVGMMSELPIFYGGVDRILERISVDYHTEYLSRGVVAISSVVFLTALIIFFLSAAVAVLKVKDY